MNDFILHEKSGLRVSPTTGLVIGRSGRLVGAPNGHGYLAVGWKEGGRVQGERVHRLVWEVVHGPIQEGMQINHKNGDKTDNRLLNLELVTRLENMRHAYGTGLVRSDGESNPRAKLREDQVAEIRKFHADGVSAYRLAKQYGVGQTTIKNIVRGHRWARAA
jgi:hypothetical protein